MSISLSYKILNEGMILDTMVKDLEKVKEILELTKKADAAKTAWKNYKIDYKNYESSTAKYEKLYDEYFKLDKKVFELRNNLSTHMRNRTKSIQSMEENIKKLEADIASVRVFKTKAKKFGKRAMIGTAIATVTVAAAIAYANHRLKIANDRCGQYRNDKEKYNQCKMLGYIAAEREIDNGLKHNPDSQLLRNEKQRLQDLKTSGR
jgi:hypothetical protein